MSTNLVDKNKTVLKEYEERIEEMNDRLKSQNEKQTGDNEKFEARVEKRTIGLELQIKESKKLENSLKGSLKQKELLLSEIHHRVKNNLQVIISLLSLQADLITDPHCLEVFKESQNRIQSMALVHQYLYQSKNFSEIATKSYLKGLAAGLMAAYPVQRKKIQLVVNSDDINLGIDTAITCGLIVNELVSNAIKYAFPNEAGGKITIDFHKIDELGNLSLSVKDNGVGLPEAITLKNPSTLGLRLIEMLIGQLLGKYELKNENGTELTIKFKPVKGV